MKNLILIIALFGIIARINAQEVKSDKVSKKVDDENVLIGLNSPIYGVKIKANFPDYSGGWASGFSISNNDNSDNFVQFGALGGAENGISNFKYAYIGKSYYNTQMVFMPDGKIGIGTRNPSAGLEVKNDEGIKVQSQKDGGWIGSIKMADGFTNTTSRDDMLFTTSGGFMFKMDENKNGISNIQGFNVYNRNNNSVFSIKEESGNVGIGTINTKGYKLAVAGKVIAEEVKVELQTNWPDYVFGENYALPSLEETENYIQENGHLQNIPSAAEVAEEGISLGAMNALLLQKIEELTLHTIDLKKRIEADKTANQKLRDTVENLKRQFIQEDISKKDTTK